MATVENIKNAVTSAVAGAKYGIHHGNQVVGAAKAIDSFMGGQAPRGGRVGAAIEGYAGGSALMRCGSNLRERTRVMLVDRARLLFAHTGFADLGLLRGMTPALERLRSMRL